MKRRILVVDIGGSSVKLLMSERAEREFASGPRMTPKQFLAKFRETVRGWKFDVVSIGFPAPVRDGRILRKPKHLGKDWMHFNFARVLRIPVRIVNDAAMQALGSYDGGAMLFLGLGTGLGSAMIRDGVLIPLELAHLPYHDGKTYEEWVGDAAYKEMKRRTWRKHVLHIIDLFVAAFVVDYVVLGGGNARHMKNLPRFVRVGSNANAFKGGFRLWE